MSRPADGSLGWSTWPTGAATFFSDRRTPARLARETQAPGSRRL